MAQGTSCGSLGWRSFVTLASSYVGNQTRYLESIIALIMQPLFRTMPAGEQMSEHVIVSENKELTFKNMLEVKIERHLSITCHGVETRHVAKNAI
jgi:hypothetical protein